MINSILLSLFDANEFFQWFMNNASYLFVLVFMIIESSFIPFPSEVIVPPAAYLACTSGAGNDMNIFVVVIVATVGALIGAYINYFLSLWIGRPVVYKFAESRIGHACLITPEKVERAEKYFDKHGAISTFIGRLIPAIRQLISVPAGLARMNLGVFTIFTVLGALLWNSILALLGYWLSLKVSREILFEKIEEYNHYLTIAGYSLLMLCIIYIAWNFFRKKR